MIIWSDFNFLKKQQNNLARVIETFGLCRFCQTRRNLTIIKLNYAIYYHRLVPTKTQHPYCQKRMNGFNNF